MKNLIEPKLLAEFKQRPTPLARIVSFLDEQPDITAASLCKLIGIPVQRVYCWRNENKKMGSPSAPGADEFKVMPALGKSNRYSAADKLALLKQYDKLVSGERAELLRKYGLYQSDITRWQEVVDAAALESLGKRKPRSDKKSDDAKAAEGLRKEVATHERTIAKLAALVILQKKVSDLLNESEST